VKNSFSDAAVMGFEQYLYSTSIKEYLELSQLVKKMDKFSISFTVPFI
jgi:hypothetical protein